MYDQLITHGCGYVLLLQCSRYRRTRIENCTNGRFQRVRASERCTINVMSGRDHFQGSTEVAMRVSRRLLLTCGIGWYVYECRIYSCDFKAREYQVVMIGYQNLFFFLFHIIKYDELVP